MNDLPCVHRGIQLSAELWHCRCPAVSVQGPGVTRAICEGCIFRDRDLDEMRAAQPTPKPPPALINQAIDCLHRGDIIDEGTADRCGRKGERFPIYACAVHGECVIGAFCVRQKWRSCLTCEDRSVALSADD